jgi:aminocarboxymuconate-semialdehyde decarboxylase
MKGLVQRNKKSMKIDIFAHICPKPFIDAFAKTVTSPEKLRETDWPAGWPMLWDVEKRLAIMEKYDNYVQVLVPTGPAPGVCANSSQAAEMASIFNDGLAEIVNEYPDKFLGAVAYLPLDDIDATLKEIDRVICELGFVGICMDTPIYRLKEQIDGTYDYDYESVKPLDTPELWPIYERMTQYDLPVWLHPRGKNGVPVYPGEERGRHLLAQVIGWPMESAMAMSRMICGGVLAKYPDLKMIIHHCGSAIIPALAGRLEEPFDFKLQGADPDGTDPFKIKPPIEHLRMFYADTALCGDVPILMCGHAFFGADHILFGTDYPYDKEGGDLYIRRTIEAVHSMDISDVDKTKIFEGNARRILKMGRNAAA